MRRSTIVSLLLFLVIALGSLGATLAAGNSPNLGLDLQGGASVVLRPAASVSDDVLDQSIEIIRSRVDALGVAEPDISRQGDTIVVQLPGVKDQTRALEIVGQTAELRFRPVLGVVPPEGETVDPSTTSTTAPADPAATTTTVAGDPGSTTSTTAAPTTAGEALPTTPPEENKADATVVLPQCEAGVRNCIGENADKQEVRYQLGPAELTGKAVRTAKAAFPTGGGAWQVDFELTGEGSKGFDEMAARNLNKQVAIELDGFVKSAPTIQTAEFGGQGQITGDFTEREAKDLALVLRYGSLPVQLEQDAVQTVSASLGRDSLNAGLAAGLGGLLLVLLYMIVYYRALGVVVVLGLGFTGALMWSVVSFLGETSGLALSLAGATGLIVSVGVTVDSYVVYFERLRDEIRSGKTVRSSVDRGFTRAFRTIFAANFVSFIGAALLYILTVGPVRGFAFFLALSTVFDVIVAYFFTRPMVILLGRNRLFTEAPFFGVARGLAVRGDDDGAPERKRGIFFRLYYGETNFQVVARRRLWFLLSGIVILLGMGSVAARGLNFGIDFEGGTAWEVQAPGVSVAEARDALRPVGLADAKVQVLGDDRLRVQADLEDAEDGRTQEVSTALSELAGGNEVDINEVGPSWGSQITEKAQRALIFFFLAIALYITLRFEWKMAVAALAAVVHDILVTVGVYSLFGLEISPATVISMLTILGFSLYDTIVVFDKVDENTKGLAASGRMTYADTANVSMNQVLMRSLNTSVVAILPVLSVLVVGAWILGATTLQDFGLALAIGLVTGAYSSIYIATPLLAILKEREPRYAAIRERLANRSGGGSGLLTPAAAGASAGGGAAVPASEGAAPTVRPTMPTTGQPPRGRKKKRR